MKKLNYIALASLAAAITAVSCSKEEMQSSAVSEGTVLTASIAQAPDTKTNMSSATENTNVSIVWTAGDKLSVLSGASYGTNSEFTLNSGDAGKPSGSFSGAEISGDIIAVYPYASDVAYSTNKVTLNIPQTQAYTDATFAQNSVPMVASGTVGANLDFKYLFSAIAFKVKGSGKSVTKVTVAATTPLWGPTEISNLDATPTITMTGTDSKYRTVELTYATAQDITSDKVFYVAVPAGTYTFAVNVYCSDNTVFHQNYTTAKTFAIGKIKYNSTAKSFSDNGPAYVEGSYIGEGKKVAGYWWAQVNCGYDATDYKYGKLYQWGRHDGGGYGATWTDLSSQTVAAETVIQSATQGPISAENENASYFYKNGTLPKDWLSTQNNYRWNSATGDNDPSQTTQVTPSKTGYDPCPIGWRVPTYYELNALLGTKMSTAFETGDGTIKGYHFGTNENNIFLPAAGRRAVSTGNVFERESQGYYWCSSVNGTDAWYLVFKSSSAEMNDSYRANGYSVRCVQK